VMLHIIVFIVSIVKPLGSVVGCQVESLYLQLHCIGTARGGCEMNKNKTTHFISIEDFTSFP